MQPTSDRISIQVFRRRRHLIYFLPGTFLALYRSRYQCNGEGNKNNNNENPGEMEEKKRKDLSKLGSIRTTDISEQLNPGPHLLLLALRL